MIIDIRGLSKSSSSCFIQLPITHHNLVPSNFFTSSHCVSTSKQIQKIRKLYLTIKTCFASTTTPKLNQNEMGKQHKYGGTELVIVCRLIFDLNLPLPSLPFSRRHPPHHCSRHSNPSSTPVTKELIRAREG